MRGERILCIIQWRIYTRAHARERRSVCARKWNKQETSYAPMLYLIRNSVISPE